MARLDPEASSDHRHDHTTSYPIIYRRDPSKQSGRASFFRVTKSVVGGEKAEMRKINTRSYRLATRSTPREVNRQIVHNLIREHQPISRAELARQMNVRRASLTGIVRDLL